MPVYIPLRKHPSLEGHNQGERVRIPLPRPKTMTDTNTTETTPRKRGRPLKYGEGVVIIGMRLPRTSVEAMDAECKRMGKPGPDETFEPLSRTEFMARAIKCYCKKLANVRRNRKKPGRLPVDVN